MNILAKKTEAKIAKTKKAAQDRHEARQKRAAERQQEQQKNRTDLRRARKEAQEKGGNSGRLSGRPLVADAHIHLHAVTVRLDEAQYQQR